MIALGLPGQLAPILGPVIGGSIVQWASWHWLFFVNVPICVTALVLAPVFLPAEAGRRGHRLDVTGFALLTPGVVALAYGISQAAGPGGFAAVSAWLPLCAEAPRGSAAFSVVQRVGAPFGIAVIAVILEGHLSHATTAGAALGAFTTTFWWILGLSAVPLLLAFFIPRRKAESAEPGQEASSATVTTSA